MAVRCRFSPSVFNPEANDLSRRVLGQNLSHQSPKAAVYAMLFDRYHQIERFTGLYQFLDFDRLNGRQMQDRNVDSFERELVRRFFAASALRPSRNQKQILAFLKGERFS